MIRLLVVIFGLLPVLVLGQVPSTVPKLTGQDSYNAGMQAYGLIGEFPSSSAARQAIIDRGYCHWTTNPAKSWADGSMRNSVQRFLVCTDYNDNTSSNWYYAVSPTGTSDFCPEGYPVDNGDGTCSLAEPEDLNDCPIGTRASSGSGVLGDGTAPECVPFECQSGGQNVSIPSQFFEVDFGGASFSYCDGSCGFSVQSGSGGQVNAWGTGMACGNGTPDYVYAVPTFDDASCTSGDGWVDCSDNPQKVDENNPQNPDVPTTPDDLGAPLEELPDPVDEPLPDCTAETALSGSCFVNSMDAVQGNIVNGITTEQSQQTDRIVTALAGLGTKLIESESDAADKITKAIKEGERASSLPFLKENFRPVAQDDLNGLTVSEIATATGEDLTGIDFDNLIPKTTKALGWNPTEYQFGVGGGLCPEPTSLVIGGQTISLDWTMFCDMAVIINAFLIAAAYFIGGQIIMRAM